MSATAQAKNTIMADGTFHTQSLFLNVAFFA